MIKIKLKNNTYLFIEFDQDSHSHSLTKFKTHTVINYKRTLTGDSNWSENIGGVNVKLLNYEIISTTKDITEEQAESIVEKYTNYETETEQLLDGMYEDYLEKGNYWVQDSSGTKLWAFKTAKESLQSLIQSLGLDVNKNYLILQKL